VKYKYEVRQRVFIIAFLIAGLLIVAKLFFIQVLSSSYKVSAEKNVLRYIYDYPARGLIYDRNGKLLVHNDATYDLMVIPRQIKEFDTIQLCKLLNVDLEVYKSKLTSIKKYSMFLPSILVSNLSIEQYSYIQESVYKFPGHFIQTRSVRKYPLPIAAHTLGYIGEVTQQTIDSNPYYRMGESIGVSGVENSYEILLRGEKGIRLVLVDVHNREKGSYEDGKHDTKPIPGSDLYLSLDAVLQEYGETLMKNKRGGIVAIEPSTGEILASVSSPAYDPNLLVGHERGNNYMKLLYDKDNNPLFNRAIMTRYPPGSTFKIVSGIAALEEGIITENTAFGCGGGYSLGSHTIKCHAHASPTDLIGATTYSCNTYFCHVFKNFIDNRKFASSQDGYERWRTYIISLGFGVKLGTDFPNELSGFVPTVEFYNDRLRRSNWKANNIMSIAIGQGEIGVTPLQLANFTAIIANRGWYIPPHIVKAINNIHFLNSKYQTKVQTMLSKHTCDIFANAMREVVTSGTARNAEVVGFEVCGKTGTAQDPPRRNHSVFIAFAPKDNPKIAIAALIENSGYGATYAAPIVSLMIEKYLTGDVSRKNVEEFIIQTSLLSR